MVAVKNDFVASQVFFGISQINLLHVFSRPCETDSSVITSLPSFPSWKMGPLLLVSSPLAYLQTLKMMKIMERDLVMTPGKNPLGDLCVSRWGSKFWTSLELTESVLCIFFPPVMVFQLGIRAHLWCWRKDLKKGFNVFALSPSAFQILVKPLSCPSQWWAAWIPIEFWLHVGERQFLCTSGNSIAIVVLCCLCLFSVSVHIHFLPKFWKQIPAQPSWCSALLAWL